MKYLKYIALSSIIVCSAIFCPEAECCSQAYYYPYGYRMYRVYNPDSYKTSVKREDNCLLWQKITSQVVSLQDIYEVVYCYNLPQLQNIPFVKQDNAFARWIKDSGGKEILDYLILAKSCETARELQADPWYYPSDFDETVIDLKHIAEEAKAYSGSLLNDRYALQAVRAMFSLHDYQGCIDYWKEKSPELKEGLIREMTESYAAGALFRTGHEDEAMEYYSSVNDVESIRYCLKVMKKTFDNIDVINIIRIKYPDSEIFPQLLQEEMHNLDLITGISNISYKERFDSKSIHNVKLAKKMLELCINQINDERVSNRSLWYYTAASISDMMGKPYKAEKYLGKAEKCRSSQFLSESIKVMRIYLDAKLSDYDDAYEKKLIKQIQWLDNRIVRDLPLENQRVKFGEKMIYMKIGLGFYYWNDMLRRILISEVCPRMIDRGKNIRALQLVNMADNRLGNLMGETFNEECRGITNAVDYSNYFFRMADWTDTEDFRLYIGLIHHPRSYIDKYLNDRGYTDDDYLYDLLGTKYLREMNYKEAAHYLGLVSAGYQNRMNVRHYIVYDPFDFEKEICHHIEDYKYNFAREMYNMQKEIPGLSDNPDRKALYLFRMATGIRNAVGFCWPLTEYHLDNRYPLHDKEAAFNKSEEMFENALEIVRDPELAANLNRRLYRWKTAATEYPGTNTANDIIAHCDELCDYEMSYSVKSTLPVL